MTNFTDSKNATHHWYPFLKYQEECEAAGKEASVNEWMRASGQLQNRIDFEETKKAAEADHLICMQTDMPAVMQNVWPRYWASCLHASEPK